MTHTDEYKDSLILSITLLKGKINEATNHEHEPNLIENLNKQEITKLESIRDALIPTYNSILKKDELVRTYYFLYNTEFGETRIEKKTLSTLDSEFIVTYNANTDRFGIYCKDEVLIHKNKIIYQIKNNNILHLNQFQYDALMQIQINNIKEVLVNNK